MTVLRGKDRAEALMRAALLRIEAMPCITALLGDDTGDCMCASCDAAATLVGVYASAPDPAPPGAAHEEER